MGLEGKKMQVPGVAVLMESKAAVGMKGMMAVVELRDKMVAEVMDMKVVEEMGKMLVAGKGMRESLLRMEP